jgi:hypothetical protein
VKHIGRKAALAAVAGTTLGLGAVYAIANVDPGRVPAGNGVAHACYADAGGRLRVVSDPSKCHNATETKINLVSQTPFVEVAANGTPVRRALIAGVSHPQTGVYEIALAATEGSTCAAAASVADPNVTGVITAFGNEAAGRDVTQVETRSLAGTPQDMAFHVVFAC